MKPAGVSVGSVATRRVQCVELPAPPDDIFGRHSPMRQMRPNLDERAGVASAPGHVDDVLALRGAYHVELDGNGVFRPRVEGPDRPEAAAALADGQTERAVEQGAVEGADGGLARCPAVYRGEVVREAG